MTLEQDSKPTILVVEDETPIRTLTVACLRRAGYEVLEARDPQEATHHFGLDLFRINVLLTDINMPGKNGQDFASELLGAYPNIKVVFASGSVCADDRDLKQISPRQVFLSKPYTPEQLRAAVFEALCDENKPGRCL